MRVAAGAVCLLASAAWGQSFVNWETPHVHPLDLTPDGSRLLAVNTADNRLEVYTVTAWGLVPAGAVPVGLDPVSVRARTSTEAWVVNHVSDSVSIVDLTALNVVRTVHPGDEPADVVFAGTPQRAFVSVAQENRVAVYDPADLSAPVAFVAIAGEDPRELATDGDTVYAAIFESGNRTTALFHEVVSGPLNPYPGDPNPPPNSGSGFNPAINPALPPAPPVGLIVKKDAAGVWRDDNGADWSAAVTWDLHDHDVAIIDAATLGVTYATGTMNLNMALALRPDGAVTVVGTDAINHVRFEPVVKGIFVRVMGAVVNGPGDAGSVVDLNPHLDYLVPTVDQATRDLSIGDPRGIAWRAAGDRAYVSGMGSNNLVVLGPSLARVGLVEVGEGPTGVVVDEARGRVYVLNKFEGSISIVDAQGLTELDRVEYHDPTPAAVTAGRPHLYDTHKTSGLGQASCASCHVDGRMDQLAWDLGNPAGNEKPFNQSCGIPGACEDWHPMKGPLMTQSFQGIVGTEPFHWRGDRENLAAFNGAFVGLMGAVPLTAPQMAEFDAFVATITYPPNPFRTITNALPNSNLANGGNPLAGQQSFAVRGCATCHPLPDGTSGVIAFMAGLDQPQSIKKPQLRNQYEKTGFDGTSMSSNRGFGFFSDGSIPTLLEFIEFAFNFPHQEDLDTEAYMLAFSTDTHAGVGRQVTLPEGESSPATSVPEMIGVAGSGAVGLVAHGRVGGELRGYYYTGGAFQSDRAAEVVSTSTLESAAAGGAEITFTLVPPGSALRMGVDRDLDGVFDGDEDDAGSNPANALSLPGNVPVAGNDQGTAVQGGPVVLDVLSNDSDANGTVDPSTVTIIVAPAHGTITDIDPGTGAVTYEHGGSTIATDSFTYRVKDDHGGFSNEATVQLAIVNEVLMDVALAGVGGSVSRCIEFELFDCQGSSQVFSEQVQFTGGAASGVRLEVPIGEYECITAADPLHSLVRSITFGSGDPGHYEADFTDQSGGGGPDQSLVLGNANGDEFIDILDFGLFSGQWLATYGSSDCATLPPQADFSGDGTVFTEDFTFVAINFLREGDLPCCPASAGPGGPLVSIAVADVLGRGLSGMAAGDLNGDGWIDLVDMVAFMNGQRPQGPGVPGGLGGSGGPVADGGDGSAPVGAPVEWRISEDVVIDARGATAATVVIESKGELRIPGGSLQAVAVTVEADGRLALAGGELSAATLTVEQGGRLEVSGAKALLRVGSLVLREGSVFVWQGGTLEVDGGVYEHGAPDLVVGATGVETALRLLGGTTGAVSGDTLVGTHRGGRGVIEVAGSSFTAGGLLAVGRSGEGWLEISAGGTVSSRLGEVGGSVAGHGLVIVSGEGSAWRTQAGLQIGVKGTADVWLLDGGAIAATEVAIGGRGSVAGDGRIAASLVNGGALRPGNGVGAMTVGGDYRQTAGGSLEIEIGPGAHDSLQVEGTAALAGLLVVAVKDGSMPRAGDEFPIVSARGIQGRFDGVAGPKLSAGKKWMVRYEAAGAVLVVAPAAAQPQ